MTQYRSYLIAGIIAGLTATSGCSSVNVGKNTAQPVAQTAQTKNINLRGIPQDNETFPVVILGGGIGGLTSAIYAAMANYPALVIEGPQSGGLITQSDSVRNWPGEIEISGLDLAEKIKQQAIKAGVTIRNEKVTSVDFSALPYKITCQDNENPATKRTIKALSVIIAMGTSSNYLGVPGEQKYWGHGVSNCAVCDGGLYKDKVVAIVGGGDAAITEANYLSRIAKKVYLFVRAPQLRAIDKRKDEVLAKSNVEVRYNSSVTEVLGDGKSITSIKLTDNKTRAINTITIDGLFLAIGSTPNSTIFKNQITLDQKGYVTRTHDQETSVPGIYAIGDIADPIYKQAITAAGEGCKAALQAIEFLELHGYDKAVTTKSPSTEPEAIKTSAPVKLTPVVKPPVKTAAALTQPELIELTNDQTLRELLAKNDKVTVVDFYATWCGPCKQMHPVIDKLAQEFAGRARFVKINVDKLGKVADRYQIKSIPVFLVFDKQGKQVERLTGFKNFESFKAILNRYL